LQKNALTDRLGITVEQTFAPADIDIDPQFELVAEWRNPRTLNIAMRKDVILNRIYNWLNTRDYRLRNNPLDVLLARAIVLARQLELGFHDRLPRNMPTSVVSLIFVLDRVGKILDTELASFEEDYLRDHRLRPLFPEKAAFLEKLREEDLQRWQNLPGNSQLPPPRFIEYLGPPEAH
jgi:hypothetical protein